MTSLWIYVYQNFELFSFMVREAGQTGVEVTLNPIAKKPPIQCNSLILWLSHICIQLTA